MKITALGCLHGHYPKLDGGDLLILTGDYTPGDRVSEWCKFFEWLARQDYKKKIVIGGNHDNFLAQCIPTEEARQMIGMDGDDFEYLCDNATEYEGLKIWGMPHSLTFDGINPHCAAFTGDETYMKEKCDLIPDDIDILISHSPPYGILDAVEDYHSGKIINTGSIELLKAVDRVKPKIFLCSHIHENGGEMLMFKSMLENPSWHVDCYNVSIMNERYKPVNKPLELIL